MRVLVTGCKGQVGQALVKRLNHCTELLALDRATLDITNKKNVQIVVSDFQPDFIINAAAYTAVDKAEVEVEHAYAINRDGTRNLAEAANEIEATFIHISTDYVFSGLADEPYLESDPTDPLSVYGISKLAGEEAIRIVNPHHIILRTSWVFSEDGNNFVKTMLRLAKNKSQLSIVHDQRGGPTYAGDIADTLVRMTETLFKEKDSTLFGTYHYSGMPTVSWYEFAQAIFVEAQKHGVEHIPELRAITSVEYPTPAARPKNSALNTDKIYNKFGISPSNWMSSLNKLDEFIDKL
ncbi:dTDP-4-dehydrorhamnose reductase [Enterobacter sp. ENT03]|uniref:dTDP-4-dehydrorhamnose reductase n=1 Tax=Enterobacter sp. ENT03 TaxID=2854780 RepID=UPI001C45D6E4|nr:dTDP-4-dehydrorhamnose reductase [Enterobacter sp. ENT03]MBV7405699.1 dTDP-4-dehydrorhamnose reductase [Enterobacter sp. ENT03]